MSLLSKIQNAVKRIMVTRTGAKPQVSHLGDGVLSDVEYMQPQGLAFTPAESAQGVLLSPNAVTAAGVAVNLSGATPALNEPGTGGLHYLGTFKLYLDTDGTIHLGSKDPGDWIALASPTDQGLATRGADTSTLITALQVFMTTLGPPGPAAPVTTTQIAGAASAFNTAVGGIPGSVSSVASAKVRAE